MTERNRIPTGAALALGIISVLLDVAVFIFTLPFLLFFGSAFFIGTVFHWILLVVLAIVFMIGLRVRIADRIVSRSLVALFGSVTPASLTLYTGCTVAATWYDDWTYNKKHANDVPDGTPRGAHLPAMPASERSSRSNVQRGAIDAQPRNAQAR